MKKRGPLKTSLEIASEEINKLRSNDKDFNDLVSEIESELDKFISEKNSSKSFSPTSSTDVYINITVRAIPITGNQQKILLQYLSYKYLRSVKGYNLTLKKCLFSKKYRIISY